MVRLLLGPGSLGHSRKVGVVSITLIFILETNVTDF